MDPFVIEGKDVSFSYQDSREGIHHVNFGFRPAEIILITGNSGSGKSTFLKCINGLIPRVVEGDLQGRILLENNDIKQMNMAEISHYISSVFQNPRSQFFTTNTTSELVFSMENYGFTKALMEQRLQEITSLLKIECLLDRNIFALSGGERQMVAIASAMMLGQKIILFDEPSANLDCHNTYLFRNLAVKLKREGYTVLIADHRFYYLNGLIDRVMLVENGSTYTFESEEEFKHSSYDTRSFDLFAMNIPFQLSDQRKEKVLSLQNVCYQDILQNISLDFYTNEVTAIIGSNGIGKTTLARLLCRSISYTHGSICGEQPFYIMQDADYQLFGTSVHAELGIADHKIAEEDRQAVMEYLQLQKYADKHPFSLSGGQKQRLQVALGILSNRKVIIFDEPTSGLDLVSMKRVAKEINDLKKKACIIVISHDYEFIRYISNRIVYLHNKTVVKDFPLDAEHLTEFNQIFIEMRDEK